jgi:hypothetical protein
MTVLPRGKARREVSEGAGGLRTSARVFSDRSPEYSNPPGEGCDAYEALRLTSHPRAPGDTGLLHKIIFAVSCRVSARGRLTGACREKDSESLPRLTAVPKRLYSPIVLDLAVDEPALPRTGRWIAKVKPSFASSLRRSTTLTDPKGNQWWNKAHHYRWEKDPFPTSSRK